MQLFCYFVRQELSTFCFSTAMGKTRSKDKQKMAYENASCFAVIFFFRQWMKCQVTTTRTIYAPVPIAILWPSFEPQYLDLLANIVAYHVSTYFATFRLFPRYSIIPLKLRLRAKHFHLTWSLKANVRVIPVPILTKNLPIPIL